jgi:hypothetical protein
MQILGRVPKFLPSLGLLWTSFAFSLLGYMATAMRPRRSSRPRFLATPSSVRNLGTRPRSTSERSGYAAASGNCGLRRRPRGASLRTGPQHGIFDPRRGSPPGRTQTRATMARIAASTSSRIELALGDMAPRPAHPALRFMAESWRMNPCRPPRLAQPSRLAPCRRPDVTSRQPGPPAGMAAKHRKKATR